MMDDGYFDVDNVIGIPGTEYKERKGYNTVGLLRWCRENNVDPMSVSKEFIHDHFCKKSE